MDNKKLTKFALAVGFQVIVILLIIGFKLITVTTGTNVMLKIRPVDPRDPLRGDYVTFQYDISTLDSYMFDFDPRVGDTIYVKLKKSGKYWEAYDVYKRLPKDSRDIYLKGTVTSVPFQTSKPNYKVLVVYGTEEYFIPEGAGRTTSFWNEEVSAQVVVDSEGNSVLRQLFVEGEKWP